MPASIAATSENINAGTNGSLIEKTRKESPKPNTTATRVENAIKPKYAWKVIFTAALARLSSILLNSSTRDDGTNLEAFRQRESSCLFVV